MDIKLNSMNAAGVVHTHGAVLSSYKNDGVEYVWQGDPKYWSGQAPVLFPVVCVAMDGKMAHNGVEYPMPAHGFAKDGDFEIVSLSKNSVVLEQRETEETLKMFPFCYSLKIAYTILDTGFDVRYTVKNLDKNEMTFCIGGHPGFNCPLFDGDEFEDYKLVFDDAEGCTVSITKGGHMNDEVPKLDRLRGTNEYELKRSDFDIDTLIIEGLPKKAFNFVSKNSGRGFRFEFPGFDALALWSPRNKNAPLVCFEPWNGLTAGDNETTDAKSKKYAKTIAPDEEYSVGYSVTLI